MARARNLGLTHGTELHGWPCLLDIEFGSDGKCVGIRPRLGPPAWHAAHRAIVEDCERWTAVIVAVGGARFVEQHLIDHPVMAEAARLEWQNRQAILEAHELLARRMSIECAT